MSELEPLNDMPTRRLTDILEKLENSEPTVLNLDSLLPKGREGAQILKTFLLKLKPSVQTISLRYNILSPESIEELLLWIIANDHVRSLYLGDCGPDLKKEHQKIESAWKKNLQHHSVVTNHTLSVYTLYRKSDNDPPPPGEDE